MEAVRRLIDNSVDLVIRKAPINQRGIALPGYRSQCRPCPYYLPGEEVRIGLQSCGLVASHARAEIWESSAGSALVAWD